MRAFWPLAFINLFAVTVYTVSALWVTFNPASGCTVDGQPCKGVGAATLLLYIGGPALLVVLTVFGAARLRHHRPLVALALVAAPLLLALALFQLR